MQRQQKYLEKASLFFFLRQLFTFEARNADNGDSFYTFEHRNFKNGDSSSNYDASIFEDED